MLTLSKIQTYERFRGDIDGYSRARGGGDSSGITDDDWSLIGRLCQAIYLVASRQAADSFRVQAEQELQSVTADEPTRAALRRLARELI
jgi:hypothetical protein